MSFTRAGFTAISRASRFWLTPFGFINSSSRTSPGGMGASFFTFAMPSSSVIVNDFDILGAVVAPHETYPPLIIDADRMLAPAVSLQGFKTIARRRAQVAQGA